MTKLTKLTLTALCSSILIACGSGGGGSDNSASAINTSGGSSAVQNASMVSGKVISVGVEQDNRVQGVLMKMCNLTP
ncbi:hypothetical protein KRX11_07835 [Pasteurellaceae bacterium TAE3-ERU1]|nr:hypothetical protein [Pasteurellaceae bacterium TAE3-ERU1]